MQTESCFGDVKVMDWKERHLEGHGDYRILKQQIQDILLVQTCKRKEWRLEARDLTAT